ncbi:MAG: divalent-cation tolerance protein CutA [Elusimicrobiota bacterium]
MTSGLRVVLVTCRRGRKAEALAKGLVAARLAACVNIIPGVVSHYRWEGRLHRGVEVLLVIKTRAAQLKALERWVKARHPYCLPEILVLPVVGGSKEYLRWVADQT